MPRVGVAETAQDFSPTVDAIHVRRIEPNARAAILLRDRRAVALATEHIGARDEARQIGEHQ